MESIGNFYILVLHEGSLDIMLIKSKFKVQIHSERKERTTKKKKKPTTDQEFLLEINHTKQD